MDNSYLWGAFFGGVIGMILLAWIFTWFFNPRGKDRMMQLQINLLIRMAEQAGIPKGEIDTLILRTYQGGNPWFIQRIMQQDKDNAAFIREAADKEVLNQYK